jgi:hypothetical protein
VCARKRTAPDTHSHRTSACVVRCAATRRCSPPSAPPSRAA